jgi:hypothetical protein
MSARATRPPHQSRPNRRYRRLLPTALAVAAIAATGSSLGAPPARAAGGTPTPHRAHHHVHQSRAALVPRTEKRADTASPHVSAN